MNTAEFLRVLDILKQEYPKWNAPIVTLVAAHSNDPFLVLISTILSLRTKDETTKEGCARLFSLAKTAASMRLLPIETIRKAIYPVGFHNQKAKQIHDICARLEEEFGGVVPNDINTLLTFKGVGRKTANLVVSLGFNQPAICVDTHVHRISNILGFIKTKTPEESEFALREKVPIDRWIGINDLLVAFGQTICKSVSPFCSKCPIEALCPKISVKRRR